MKLSIFCFSRKILPTDCSTSLLGDANITVFNLGTSIPSLAIENVPNMISLF